MPRSLTIDQIRHAAETYLSGIFVPCQVCGTKLGEVTSGASVPSDNEGWLKVKAAVRCGRCGSKHWMRFDYRDEATAGAKT